MHALTVAVPALLHHAGSFRIKDLLLLWVERGVQGFGGVGAAVHEGVHFRLVLGAHGFHALQALGRAQLCQVWACSRRGVGRGPGLQHACEAGPGRVLRRRQLQLGFELLQVLGLPGLHAFVHVGRVPSLVPALMVALMQAWVGGPNWHGWCDASGLGLGEQAGCAQQQHQGVVAKSKSVSLRHGLFLGCRQALAGRALSVCRPCVCRMRVR